MTYILNCNATRSEIATNQLIYLYRLMIEEINFIELLQDASTTRLSQLCYAVGHWSFLLIIYQMTIWFIVFI